MDSLDPVDKAEDTTRHLLCLYVISFRYLKGTFLCYGQFIGCLSSVKFRVKKRFFSPIVL